MLQTEPVARVRAALVSAIGRLGDRRGISMLRAKLNDEDASVREAAAFALSHNFREAMSVTDGLLQDIDDEMRVSPARS